MKTQENDDAYHARVLVFLSCFGLFLCIYALKKHNILIVDITFINGPITTMLYDALEPQYMYNVGIIVQYYTLKWLHA